MHEVHRTGLHHILEHDAVGNMLTKGNSSRRNRIRESLVGADIVRMRRFRPRGQFRPPGKEAARSPGRIR